MPVGSFIIKSLTILMLRFGRFVSINDHISKLNISIFSRIFSSCPEPVLRPKVEGSTSWLIVSNTYPKFLLITQRRAAASGFKFLQF